MTATTTHDRDAAEWVVITDDYEDYDGLTDARLANEGVHTFAEATEIADGFSLEPIVVHASRVPHLVKTPTQDEAAAQDEVAVVHGDWQGPEPSMAMTGQRTDWRGQWLARRGTAEKWAFLARVARRTIPDNPAAGRSAEVYAAAAEHAPASVWVVIAGKHDVWDDPELDEQWEAGPFATEDEALEHCDEELFWFSAVPRMPYLAL